NVFRSDYTYYPEASGWFKLHRVPVDWHTARLQCYAEASPLNEDILKVMKDIIGESKPGTIHTGVHATFSNGVYTSVEGDAFRSDYIEASGWFKLHRSFLKYTPLDIQNSPYSQCIYKNISVPLDDLAIEWGANEPNNNGGKQECMAFFNDGMGDFSCLSNFPYICYSNFSELGQCYKFHNQAETWPRAMRICEAEGGHLAIINSQEEMMFLKELFAEHPKLLYTD
ncbi:C-type lectin, partial [Operophtera brumata]